MKLLHGRWLLLQSACLGVSRKFRIRLIPVTLLWSVAALQLFASVCLVVSLCAELADSQSADLKSQWAPILTAAIIAWLLPTGANAFSAGWFFYKGRWKAATIATIASFLFCDFCLTPMFVMITNYPGPK